MSYVSALCTSSISSVRIVSYPFFFFSSRRRHTRSDRDWSSDVCSSDLHAFRCARELQAPRQLHHLELGGAVLAGERLEDLARVRLGQSGGGGLHQIPHALVVQLGDPHHQGRERVGPELLEQLGQLVLGGMDGRFVERLEELRQRVVLRQAGGP